LYGVTKVVGTVARLSKYLSFVGEGYDPDFKEDMKFGVKFKMKW